MSGDGLTVAFNSLASNLVPGDTNGNFDIYVHNRASGATERVSVASGGGQATGSSFSPSLSADGQHVGFYSTAGNLIAGDINGVEDAFVHDRVTGGADHGVGDTPNAGGEVSGGWKAVTARNPL